MPTASDRKLDKQARDFADDLSDLLNGTLTRGVRVSSVLSDDGGICWLGVGVRPTQLVPLPFRLQSATGRKNPYLRVGQILQLDDESQYLMTFSSECSLFADKDQQKLIFHYDYKREPDEPYPSAHVQIHGVSDHLQYLCGTEDVGKQLEHFHFPVGGRRYRPSFEDVVEFLIIEELASPNDGWKDVVTEHREVWERRQLAAAVRRDPETARRALDEAD